MRKIGVVAHEESSERFLAYLRSLKIDAQSRLDGDKEFAIWVYDEDLILKAEEAFQKFQAEPNAPEFSASKLRVFLHPPKDEVKNPKKAVALSSGGLIATWWLMGLCLAITILSQTAFFKLLIFRYLYFSPSILEGEVWRLVTPALIHTDLLHFIFNMFWIYDLGGDVEREDGTRFLTTFFLVVATLCNTAQFIVSGPAFQGMSGVVYGLLGYVWMMTRYATGTRYALSDGMMLFMVCWIAVGLIFPQMSMANTQHITGLLLGLALGSFKSGHLKTSWRKFRR